MLNLQSLLPQTIAASGGAYAPLGSYANLHPGQGLTAFTDSDGRPMNSRIEGDGFSASAYQDQQGHVFVAFEGTSFNPFTAFGRGSMGADLDLIGGRNPNAFGDADAFMAYVKSAAQAQGISPSDVFVAGQSLAATIAEYVVATDPTIGGGMGFGGSGVPGNKMNADPDGNRFINFINDGDPVPNMGSDTEIGRNMGITNMAHVGMQIKIGDPLTDLAPVALSALVSWNLSEISPMISEGVLFPVIVVEALFNHTMGSYIQNLQSAGLISSSVANDTKSEKNDNYDGSGRIISEVTPDGACRIEYSYTDSGIQYQRSFQTLDENGNVTGSYFNTINAAGQETQTQFYDANGKSVATNIYNADGSISSTAYNADGSTDYVNTYNVDGTVNQKIDTSGFNLEDNNVVVTLADGISATINGSGDTIIAAANDIVNLSGSNDTVNANGFGDTINAEVNTSSVNINLHGDNDTATLNGAQNYEVSYGNGDVATVNAAYDTAVDGTSAVNCLTNLMGTGDMANLNGAYNRDVSYGISVSYAALTVATSPLP